jgi:glycosyltransferase involved in cell wall biosynthesis
MDKVAVLLSTFNGQDFLNEQLDSVLHQNGVYIELFIRDDGSSDETRNILNRYDNNYTNVHVVYGENIGVAKSFIELAIKVYRQYKAFDGYAFCDQDDLWFSGKVKSAQELMNSTVPSLVATKFYISDDKLNPISKSSFNEDFSLGNLIVEGQIPGCVMHFNYKLLKDYVSVVDTVEGKRTVIHDHLLLLVCALKGEIYCTSDEQMHYRQHSNNVIGSSKGIWDSILKYKKYLTRLRKSRTFYDEIVMLTHLLDGVNSTREVSYALMSGGGLFSRLNCAFSNVLYKRNFLSNLFFKLLVILGMFKKYE